MTAMWGLLFLPPLVAAALLFAGPALLRSAGTDPVTTAVLRAAPLTVAAGVVMPLLPGAGNRPGLTLDWLILGTELRLDTAARALLLVTAVLYGAALVAVDWAPARRRRELTGFLLLCFVGNAGVYLAADTVTFYLSFAVMSFAGYGLVINSRSAQARRAGRIYLVLTVMSEAAVLAALLLITGFGVKAGLVPLHGWLPLAHPAAPPAASAVLSGAMVKAGVMGWLRFLPMGEISLPGWGALLVVAGLAGALGTAVVGVLQDHPKVVLAYSTVSQLGFIAAVVGVGLHEPELSAVCFSAAVVYAVHHGLAKGALFLGVPVWQHHGTGARRALVAVGLLGAGLAVAGAPLSSGSVGKYAAKNAVAGYEVFGLDLITLLPLVATCSTLLLLRFGLLLWTGPRSLRSRGDAELAAWLLLVIAGIVTAWLVTESWLPVADVPGLDPVTVWDAAWPILLGLGIGGGSGRRGPVRSDPGVLAAGRRNPRPAGRSRRRRGVDGAPARRRRAAGGPVVAAAEPGRRGGRSRRGGHATGGPRSCHR